MNGETISTAFESIGIRSIVAGNVVFMVTALIMRWPVGDILWAYWGQSVIIGALNVWRILNLKNFSTENFRMNGRAVPPTNATKIKTALFFAVHYGFFHMGYAIFLGVGFESGFSLAALGLSAAIFLASHLVAMIRDVPSDARQPVVLNIGSLMFLPYLRIIPMHFIIILGSGLIGNTLMVFMVLKTLADVGMQYIEERIYRQGVKKAEEQTENPSQMPSSLGHEMTD